MMVQSHSPLIYDDVAPVGMSDEEELRRMGFAAAHSEGIGEVIVDYADDIADLGLRSE